MFKRFIGIMLSALMAFSASTSAFAAESADVSNDTNIQEVDTVSTDASDRALGKILASASATISGGYGSVTLNLPSGSYDAYYYAQIAYTSVPVPVSCTVTEPDGDSYSLGVIMGTGSTTNSFDAGYAQAGQYTFSFTSASPVDYTVLVTIRK